MPPSLPSHGDRSLFPHCMRSPNFLGVPLWHGGPGFSPQAPAPEPRFPVFATESCPGQPTPGEDSTPSEEQDAIHREDRTPQEDRVPPGKQDAPEGAPGRPEPLRTEPESPGKVLGCGRSPGKSVCAGLAPRPPTQQGFLLGNLSETGQDYMCASFSPTAHGAIPETLHLAAGAWVLPPGYSASRLQPGLRQVQLPPSAPRRHQLPGELNSW